MPAPPAVVLAAGDIGDCTSAGDEATAALMDGLAGTVLALGDLAYPDGSDDAFTRCYGPTWGRHRDRTRPVPGNHDWTTPDAAGFFRFFSMTAPAWRSFELGAWHVVALDSNCAAVGGCGPESPQGRWLQADLAGSSAARCTLAYWHHPLRSSGRVHGGEPTVEPLWRAIAAAGADVVLNGHEHVYERFAPEDGVPEFVVGTGGASLYAFGPARPGSEVRDNSTHGVLELTLDDGSYRWRFVPVAGGTFSDAGTGTCR